MVMPLTMQTVPVQSYPVVLTGGVNEDVSTIELNPGELVDCLNYFEVEGSYGGYTSFPGYEVFDGTESPSSVPLEDPDPDDDIDYLDTARELRRSEIKEVPGQDRVRGVHMYKGDVFAARDDGGAKKIYKATALGWEELAGSGGLLNAGGNCEWINENFSKYPVGAGNANTECLFMVDGASEPVSYDGTTLRNVGASQLPSDPGFQPAPMYPTHLASFDNRLWLAFPGGHLYFSELGDPGAWDAANGAGTIPTGDEITGLIVSAGNVLIVFMRHSTKIVYVAERPTGDFGYQLKEYSQRSGCLPHTCNRLLGEVYFCDDRGPSVFTTSDRFGDFRADMITPKVQRTYLHNKGRITTTVINRELNQWRIFFDDTYGLCFTFHNKRVKGVTPFKYNVPVVCATEGDDPNGKERLFFGSENGFVYEMDKGTSYDGDVIVTRMKSSYYHYRTPRKEKQFQRLTFEITAEHGTTFSVNTDYDYHSFESPRNIPQEPTIYGKGGIWGADVWKKFRWGSAYVDNPTIYIQGYGVNMSVELWTKEKFRAQHIIHNFITDYLQLSTKM